MKLKIILFVLVLFSSNLVFSQHANNTVSNKTLTGKLEKRKWSKTTESYCAQGSDYYVIVLQKDSTSHVLVFNEKIKLETTVDVLLNQTISVYGYFETKIIKQSNDPMVQQPLGGDFYCSVFMVKNIMK